MPKHHPWLTSLPPAHHWGRSSLGRVHMVPRARVQQLQQQRAWEQRRRQVAKIGNVIG
jgi:hypothetical protein